MGVIKPEERGTTGPGRGMRFSETNLVQLGMTEHLQKNFKLGTLTILTVWKLHARGTKEGEEFSDFWENSRYGEDLEVLFVEAREGALVQSFMERVKKEDQFSEELMAHITGDFEYIRTIALGKLKKKVRRSLGLD